MFNLLLDSSGFFGGSSDFFGKYGLLIVLAVALALLMFMSFNRRKREEANRVNLNELIIPGAKVKTYSGLYGKIISIEETTDGKIVLLETGDEKHRSYQTLHINAIFGLDEKQPVVLDANGNEVFPDLEKLEAERLAAQQEVKVEQEKPKPAAKKPAAAKTAQNAEKPKTTTKKAVK